MAALAPAQGKVTLEVHLPEQIGRRVLKALPGVSV